MSISGVGRLRTSCLFFASAALAVVFMGAPPASARGPALTAWQTLYGDISASSDVAQCALCHATDPGGASWNQYGWDIRDVRANDPNCSTWEAAILCVQDNFSVSAVAEEFTYIDEIEADSQPGWTTGNANTVYTLTGDLIDQLPWENGTGLEPYDPDGAGGTGGMGGMGGIGGMGGTGGDDMFPPGQLKRGTIVVVGPGESIQAAIDRAQPGTRIYVLAGDYTEPGNPTNGLNITKSGIHLIGQNNPQKRVRLLQTGNQRNGIVVVPPEVQAAAQPEGRVVQSRTDCMGCHSDMGPPFPLHADVPKYIPTETDPYIYDVTIEGITVQGFSNNGFFTEHVDGFVFDDIESIDNRNYGIFPVLSKNGVIRDSFSTGSDLDSALWVETSEHVLVQGNVVTNSTNGIEVSNSDDVLVIDNEAYNNAIGAAILLLPDIYENRGSAKRIDLVNNWFHDNNRPNGARPGSILSFIPRGQGILYVGVDESLISGNLVEDNDFVGIAIVDYCLPFQGTPFDCSLDPTVTPEFLADQAAENNTVVNNDVLNNGTMPDPGPFQPFAADLTLLTFGDHNNCFQNNIYDTEFSTLGVLPPCAP